MWPEASNDRRGLNNVISINAKNKLYAPILDVL